ncbi:MAG: hypothetical protein AAF805_07565 [Planctomycetota bacterium]
MTADQSPADPANRLLMVASDARRGAAVADALLANTGGDTAAPTVVATVADALAALRTRPFDAVVALHEPPAIDGLTLARALRGAGDETPVALVGHERAIDLEPVAWEAGADEYACLAETAATQLAARLRRAITTRQRLRELRRLLGAEGRRLSDARDETTRAIDAQRRLLGVLRAADGDSAVESVIPITADREARDPLTAYAETLRGALVGQTDRDPAELAITLAAAGVAPPALLETHLATVADAVADLSPAAEAIVRRDADARLLEATVHLAEAYRQRYAAAAGTTAVANAPPSPPSPRLRVAG